MSQINSKQLYDRNRQKYEAPGNLEKALAKRPFALAIAEIEKQVLCSFMLDVQLARIGRTMLKPEHFSLPECQKMLSVFYALLDKGKVLEPLTIVQYLEQNDGMAFMDASLLVNEFIGATYSFWIRPDAFMQWCRTLVEASAKRQLLRLTERAQVQTIDGEAAFDSVLEGIRNDLANLASFTQWRRSAWMVDILNDPRALSASAAGAVPTGMVNADQLLRGGGLLPGDLVFIGARTNRGKSTLARQWAANVCANYQPGEEKPVVLIFALEEDKEASARRILGIRAELSYASTQSGLYTPEEAQRRRNVIAEMAEWRMAVMDVRRLTLADIAQECRAIRQETGRLDLVVVDYLDLLQSGKEFGVHRVQELAYFTRELKIMAGEADIRAPFVVPVQIKRDAVDSSGKYGLADFRGSGTIEQDADKCVIIQEPETEMPGSYEVEATLAKQREGVVGSWRMTFDRTYGGFAEVYGSKVIGLTGMGKAKKKEGRRKSMLDQFTEGYENNE